MDVTHQYLADLTSQLEQTDELIGKMLKNIEEIGQETSHFTGAFQEIAANSEQIQSEREIQADQLAEIVSQVESVHQANEQIQLHIESITDQSSQLYDNALRMENRVTSFKTRDSHELLQ